MAFEPVLDDAELWVGEMRAVRAGGARVLLVRSESGVCAYPDRCPHLGYPLSEGRLEGDVLTCAAHHHSFEASTGRGINPLRPCLTPLPTRVEGGRILVDVASATTRQGR
jgi:toluene monooxygenase system ferredoxin subunit